VPASGSAELRTAPEIGLGGGVLVLGPPFSGGLDGPKIRSLASWYLASRSVRVCGTGGGEELFERVVIGDGRLSILIGAWMIIAGGGETTAAEVDDLNLMSCGIGGVVFLTPCLNQLSRTPAEEGRIVS
jgi:hypothetical protein